MPSLVLGGSLGEWELNGGGGLMELLRQQQFEGKEDDSCGCFWLRPDLCWARAGPQRTQFDCHGPAGAIRAVIAFPASVAAARTVHMWLGSGA